MELYLYINILLSNYLFFISLGFHFDLEHFFKRRYFSFTDKKKRQVEYAKDLKDQIHEKKLIDGRRQYQ